MTLPGPRVSVVMATYNHAAFVKEAIDSVLRQQGVDFEFLIADDGSSDDTRAVVAAIEDHRISFFPNPVNRGACTVLNELVERTRGEYVALINSDDAWYPDKLRYQVDVLDRDPNLGATFGRVTFFDRDGRSLNKQALPFGAVFDQDNRSSAQWLRRFFDGGNCICHPTMLIRRSCYDQLGLYSNRLRQLPDYDMWIRLVKRYELHVSERNLIKFRILPGESASSQTTTNLIRAINEHYLIADTFFDGVERAQMIAGFSDLLTVKDIPTARHLDIEKALLFFLPNELERPYRLIGLLRMRRLLDSPVHRDVLLESYGIDDRWFQRKTGEVDALIPRMVAAASHSRAVAQAALRRFSAFLARCRH